MKLLFVIISFFILGTGSAYAEMVAVSTNLADIRSSPSMFDSIVLIRVPRHYPLSTEDTKGDFFKVKDYLDNTGWILKSSVKNTRAVIVKNENINVRKGPGVNNPIVLKAQTGVTFKVIGEKDDWLEVEHETGKSGWISKNLVWGNY